MVDWFACEWNEMFVLMISNAHTIFFGDFKCCIPSYKLHFIFSCINVIAIVIIAQ